MTWPSAPGDAEESELVTADPTVGIETELLGWKTGLWQVRLETRPRLHHGPVPGVRNEDAHDAAAPRNCEAHGADAVKGDTAQREDRGRVRKTSHARNSHSQTLPRHERPPSSASAEA